MAVKKKWVALGILLGLAVAGGVVGYLRWKHNQIFVSTDDAYVGGRIYTVAPQIPGKILTLPIDENMLVQKDQVMATIDPKDYDAAIARAGASLSEAQAGVATNQAAIAQAKAQVLAYESQLRLAKIDRGRIQTLYERQSIPKQKYDDVVTREEVAQAQLKAAQKTVAQAEAALSVAEERIKVAQAALDQAQLQRSYCTITSPVTGYISRKLTQVGQVLAPGQPICAVVPLALNDIWVEANYKETQLGHVRVGQPVKISADIDKDRTYRGTVEGISAGTGAVFSLLPPENATGNWVKVVQRVPVRVKIDPASDPNHELRLGLSVSCEIDTRKH